MGYRLSKITTRTGDEGTTGLANGERVGKDSPRVAALGAVDELNSWVGFVMSQLAAGEVRDLLADVQQLLFDVGAELSLPGSARVTEAQVERLDDALARFNARLAPLREFVLPGGSPAAAACHVARTVCRRAEAQVVALQRSMPAGESRLIPCLNRLSDLLFVLARVQNGEGGVPETLWRNPGRT